MYLAMGRLLVNLSRREKIPKLGIELPTSLLGFGYLSTDIR